MPDLTMIDEPVKKGDRTTASFSSPFSARFFVSFFPFIDCCFYLFFDKYGECLNVDVKRRGCTPDIWHVLDKMYCQKEKA
jgi:hypothetical protein